MLRPAISERAASRCLDARKVRIFCDICAAHLRSSRLRISFGRCMTSIPGSRTGTAWTGNTMPGGMFPWFASTAIIAGRGLRPWWFRASRNFSRDERDQEPGRVRRVGKPMTRCPLWAENAMGPPMRKMQRRHVAPTELGRKAACCQPCAIWQAGLHNVHRQAAIRPCKPPLNLTCQPYRAQTQPGLELAAPIPRLWRNLGKIRA
jgi:hypothetical protein